MKYKFCISVQFKVNSTKSKLRSWETSTQVRHYTSQQKLDREEQYKEINWITIALSNFLNFLYFECYKKEK